MGLGLKKVGLTPIFNQTGGIVIMKQLILEKNIPCKLRDGTMLYADIYRPDEAGVFPILLTRLPYSKDDPFYSHRYLDTNRLVSQGYVVIIQDVRGRYESEGEFYPFETEAEDGYDTVEWAAKLPYSSGDVGMFGLSYYGFTQLLAAREQSPYLKAIFPAMTLNDLRENMLYQDGILKPASIKTWILASIVPDQLKRTYKDEKIYQSTFKQWLSAMEHLENSYQDVPLHQWGELKDLGVSDYFFDWFARSPDSNQWKRTSIKNDFEKLNVPAYHLAGWYDNFLQSTIDNFHEMNRKTNSMQKLMIGPWTHGDFGQVAGERDFGRHASENLLAGKEDLTALHLRWFDYHLKGKQTGIKAEAPIKLFVMGINQWRDEYEWPLARTSYVPYYLHSQGQANTRCGDGVLNTELPGNELPDTFIHDAMNPVPTKGGQTLFHGVHTSGPQDQRTIEDREDVLVYTTTTLGHKLEVTGPIKVILYTASTAKETTFTAKLVDVHPDGTAYNLTDGIVRATYRHSAALVGEVNKQIKKLEIDLWATSNVFLPGHRLRLEIASSSFPRFNTSPRNQSNESDKEKPITQTIYHTSKFPSYIELPVIEEKA